MIKKCKNCKKDILNRRSTAKYCSQECYQKEYVKKWNKTPQAKKKKKEYGQKKEVKDRKRKYNQRPEALEYKKEYYNRPEVIIRKRNKAWMKQGMKDMTVIRYNEMFNEQNGCCFICGDHQSEITKTLHVDHDHDNGEVRGLLCSDCNLGIGLLKEDVNILRNAVKYLEKKELVL